ncbi:hypothetical protein W97_01408 [Coniosporium apollinis CBS 100218]|uniref:Uncharacterized protein n=1 Tax=Coniosporium apollinis (strain CBS 100218) TaxID=1168221 RepID=R7YJY7_CONA1|nr:uncharacterized protein W97_01408 [Coniosporium apollinis CBS 100218]EON62188.1 hypothetical protein W97_01408 [Coniosporium apollinis CBS 100218]
MALPQAKRKKDADEACMLHGQIKDMERQKTALKAESEEFDRKIDEVRAETRSIEARTTGMKYTRSVPMIDLDVLDAIRAEDLAAAFSELKKILEQFLNKLQSVVENNMVGRYKQLLEILKEASQDNKKDLIAKATKSTFLTISEMLNAWLKRNSPPFTSRKCLYMG